MLLARYTIKQAFLILLLICSFTFLADGLWAHEVILKSGRQIDGEIIDKNTQGIEIKLSSGIIVKYIADEVLTIDDKPYSAFILEITPQKQKPQELSKEKEVALEVQTEEIIFQTVKESNIPMLEELVSEGKDLDRKNKEGLTPLMYAVSLDDKDMVEALIANGASIDIKNSEDQTALDLARESASQPIIDVLIKAGAARDKIDQVDVAQALDEKKVLDEDKKKSAAALKQAEPEPLEAENSQKPEKRETASLPQEGEIIDLFDEAQINMDEVPDELKGILGALESMDKKELEEQFLKLFSVMGPIILIIDLALSLFMIITFWRIFEKAHAPGWGILVPFYNFYLFLKIAGLSGWWMLGIFVSVFIPFIGMIIPLVSALLISLGIARGFGKSVPFALGLLFLPLIFYPILAYSKAEYGFYRS
jgi:hypothetical protein